jgi:hypothetical protein
MKMDAKFRTMIAVTAAVMTISSCAGLTDSTDSGSRAYSFKVAQNPVNSASGWTVSVQLVDAKTGQPVGNAQLFERQMVPAPSPKIVPGFQERLIPLTPDGRGGYLYTQHSFLFGETLRLAARVPGKDGLIRGTAQITG